MAETTEICSLPSAVPLHWKLLCYQWHNLHFSGITGQKGLFKPAVNKHYKHKATVTFFNDVKLDCVAIMRARKNTQWVVLVRKNNTLSRWNDTGYGFLPWVVNVLDRDSTVWTYTLKPPEQKRACVLINRVVEIQTANWKTETRNWKRADTFSSLGVKTTNESRELHVRSTFFDLPINASILYWKAFLKNWGRFFEVVLRCHQPFPMWYPKMFTHTCWATVTVARHKI